MAEAFNANPTLEALLKLKRKILLLMPCPVCKSYTYCKYIMSKKKKKKNVQKHSSKGGVLYVPVYTVYIFFLCIYTVVVKCIYYLYPHTLCQ